ncbi:MAG: glycosyltransferase family 2 protein [Candidatus Binataceae bacterium]
MIIPTKNRRTDLLTAFRSLLRQTILPTQVVVVDQSPDDSALRYLQTELAGIGSVRLDYVYDPTLNGAAAARNRAMDLATGDLWLFLDDDVELESDFIEKLIEGYEKRPGAGGICGIITNYPLPSATSRLWAATFARGPFHDERQPIYWKCERLRNSEPIPVRKFTSALMSFRSSVIGDVRFDSNYPGALAEDVDFCWQLPPGTLMFIAPQARLVHNRSPANRVRSHWLRTHAESSYYLYERHLKKQVTNRLYFAWLKIGYALAAFAACVKDQSLESWGALKAGRIAGKTYAHPSRNFA